MDTVVLVADLVADLQRFPCLEEGVGKMATLAAVPWLTDEVPDVSPSTDMRKIQQLPTV